MLRANFYKKFSKSSLPKAVEGVDQPAVSKDPYLSRGYMPTMFQMYEDSGLSAENFFKSNPLQNASEYRIPSTSSYGLIPKRNIYNPAYGNPGIYDAFFLDNQSISTFKNNFAYPTRTHDLSTNSIQQAGNAWKVPGDRQTVFCEGESCLQSVPGENERAERLYTDLNNTYNDFKDKPERFQYFYDKMKKDGYLSNPFAENSSLRVRSKKLNQTPATLNVKERNNITLPSQDKVQTPTYNFAIPESVNLPNNNAVLEKGMLGRNPVQPITPLTADKRNNITLSDQTNTAEMPANSSYSLDEITGKKITPNVRGLAVDQRNNITLPSQNKTQTSNTGTTQFQANTSGPLNFNVPSFPSRNDSTGAPMGTTVQTDLNGNQSSFAPGYGPQNATQKIEGAAKKTTSPDYNSMFTLGLGAIDMGLGYNEDLKNQRILNESIQNRQSKPLYDYNYMYGRTTSGGTEYQPTIKAEMGAQITKRFNTPYGANNVEIEGGEFIQLPNFDTEHAEGPSHERGGIKTSLPEGTRVYSDHLKPEGSKKTFAQLAKKYDISSFQKILDDQFKKQVDKDTATIMLRRNQTKLDELFNQQQSMNGNSNGEMRDGGINNPGFRALPKAVQDQILANMEYGGYQLAEYDGGGITPYEASKTPEGGTTPTGKSNKFSTRKQKLEDYLGQWTELIPGINKMTEGQAQDAIYSWSVKNNPEALQAMWKEYGNTAKGKKDKTISALAPSGTFSEEFLKDPKNLEKLKPAYVDNLFGVRQVDPKKPTDPTASVTPGVEKPVETPVTEPEFPKGNTYGMSGTTPKGTYVKDPFNMGSLIPNAYGLSQAQTTYSYGIPEIDSPYLRPQTLNVQSQLQDIDNMGTAAVRGGADPLASYIAGMDAKQKTFQTKQNFDAEGRSKADMFNAQAKTQADIFNAEAFDKNYNERNALAKAYQSQEKSKQLANAVDKYSNWDKTEASKKFLYDNCVTSFDLDRSQNDATTVAGEGQPFFVGNPLQNIVDNALGKSTEKTKATNTKKTTKKLPK